MFNNPPEWESKSQIPGQPVIQIPRKHLRWNRTVQGFPTVPLHRRNSQKIAGSRYSGHHFSRLPMFRQNMTKQMGFPTT